MSITLPYPPVLRYLITVAWDAFLTHDTPLCHNILLPYTILLPCDTLVPYHMLLPCSSSLPWGGYRSVVLKKQK